MTHRPFKEMRLSRMATVPRSYSREVRWLSQIGDIVPNFLTASTRGPIAFHAWAEGSWVFLFSHPALFTPVSTTELASFAAAQADFKERGVKLLGVSIGSVETQARWHTDIERLYGLDVSIPVQAGGNRPHPAARSGSGLGRARQQYPRRHRAPWLPTQADPALNLVGASFAPPRIRPADRAAFLAGSDTSAPRIRHIGASAVGPVDPTS